MLVDVHCHLDFDSFTDLDEVVERAKKAGVVSIITNGTSKKSNREVIEIAKKHDIVKPALGLYPDEALKMNDRQIRAELEFIRKFKPIAIGEVGLDNYKVKNIERQKEMFAMLIRLAKELDVPIIVHARQAEQIVFDMLSAAGMKKVIMHCFSGSLPLAKKIEEKGWYFSIPAIITYSTQFQDLVNAVSSTRLLTETDAPFLAPVKGQRNEPAFVAETIKKIAEIKKIEPMEAENIIFMNYKRLFG